MSQSTLNYTFNLCIIIGFVIPLLNLLTGWFGSLFGAGADTDFNADAGLDTGLDVGLDAGLDIGLDAGLDIGLDAGLDIGLDAGLDIGLDTGLDLGGSPLGGSPLGGAAGSSAAGADMGAAPSGHGGLLPFNVMCLCLSLVVFGALGKMTIKWMAAIPLTALLLAGCILFAAFSYWALYTFLIKRLKENDASVISYRDLKGMDGEVTLSISENSLGTISVKDSTGAALSFRARIDPQLKSQMPDTIPKGETVVITEVDIANKLCYVSMYPRNFMVNKVYESQ